MKLSYYGQHYSGPSAIVTLMDDLGSALRAHPGLLMMGGGSPARIPEVEQLFQQTLQQIAGDAEQAQLLLGRYQGPKGDLAVRELLAQQLAEEQGWPLTADHIALTNGGQSAFGIIANMLAGSSDMGHRTLHFPLVPEYLGYADAGIEPGSFSASQPTIKFLDDGLFKYTLDPALTIPASAAALCVSRPTNPSGNVLSDAELQWLDAAAHQRDIPLIIDAAYGLPFPALHYSDDSNPYWSDNVILLLSLSKVGLPGVRSGFVIAKPEFIEAFSRANTILNLAVGNLGPALALLLLQDRRLQRLSREVLQPWYKAKAETALRLMQTALLGVPCHIHIPQGAFFLWLWLPGLPVSTTQLYEELKLAGLLVIPGDGSFFALHSSWQHSHECLRLSYAVSDQCLQQGSMILAQVLRRLFA